MAEAKFPSPLFRTKNGLETNNELQISVSKEQLFASQQILKNIQ